MYHSNSYFESMHRIFMNEVIVRNKYRTLSINYPSYIAHCCFLRVAVHITSWFEYHDGNTFRVSRYIRNGLKQAILSTCSLSNMYVMPMLNLLRHIMQPFDNQLLG